MSKSSTDSTTSFHIGSPSFMKRMAEKTAALNKRIHASTPSDPDPVPASRTPQWEANFVSAPVKTAGKRPTSKPGS